jgi:hypothetical protein
VHMQDKWLRVDKQLKKAMRQELMVYTFDIDVSIHIRILNNLSCFFLKKRTLGLCFC